MQIALGVAGIRRRHQFRPRQIGHDEFGRRDQSAVIGAAREVMARGDPEFSHVRSVVLASVLISPRRSTSSAGSTSPSTSWKVKALAWACNRSASAATGRGLSVRKRSRISPFSTLRCTASSVCGGCSHSEACECDLLLGGKARGLDVRRPEFLHQLPGEPLDHRLPLGFRRFGDDGKRRPAQTVDPEKARTQRHALLLAERGRIPVPEHERAGNRPFAGFGRPLEDERIRRVQPDGSRKFQHVRLIRISDRAPAHHTKWRVQAHPQDCSAPALRCRPAGSTRRSPLTSMPRRSPALRLGSRSR